ncbi:MAG: DUF1275 domain-containing protein [Reyranella sp.]|uniref:DUF1275 family protein n=1 Tax=Reyranella sp. TaxID=1929291 RepID=UPI001AC938D6|nr:DUF1275 family protein [Reyranella sp.]MBN9089479.1 DUF1275 domain-containing protein [Reyranella sp.]
MTKDTSLGPVPTMSLLAFTSGFVDSLSFIALFGLFAAHVTGNMIQVIVDMVDIVQGHGPLEAKRARLKRLGPMLLAFIAGTLMGAVGYIAVGFYSLLVPIVAVVGLAMRVRPHTVPA